MEAPALNSNLTKKEREHLLRVKSLPCSICDDESGSEAHHAKQGQTYTCIALCPDCHRGTNGWHGNKSYWRIRKADELSALNITIKRLVGH